MDGNSVEFTEGAGLPFYRSCISLAPESVIHLELELLLQPVELHIG